jgi:hypothetical protein
MTVIGQKRVDMRIHFPEGVEYSVLSVMCPPSQDWKRAARDLLRTLPAPKPKQAVVMELEMT